MDNKSIAGILYETADLLEVDGQDSFRIRSYRNAAEAIEALPQQVTDLIEDPKQVLAIPGIGKGMLANLNEMLHEGKLSLHAEMLKKYRPSMLELLKVQGLGPKTTDASGAVAWSWTVGTNTSPGSWPVTVTCGAKSVRTAVTVPRTAAHGREARAEIAEGD